MSNSTRLETKLRLQLIFALFLATALILFFGTSSHAAENNALSLVRIGYQKYGSLNVVKAQGTFDRELAQRGNKNQVHPISGRPSIAGRNERWNHRYWALRRTPADLRASCRNTVCLS